MPDGTGCRRRVPALEQRDQDIIPARRIRRRRAIGLQARGACDQPLPRCRDNACSASAARPHARASKPPSRSADGPWACNAATATHDRIQVRAKSRRNIAARRRSTIHAGQGDVSEQNESAAGTSAAIRSDHRAAGRQRGAVIALIQAAAPLLSAASAGPSTPKMRRPPVSDAMICARRRRRPGAT